jgi:hypothetical protein
LAVLLAVGLMVVACGGDDEADGDQGQGAQIVRFAFAPDPVWDYLNDTGEVAMWEEANNLRIVTSVTWDEMTFFGGGHGEIVSMGTHELPLLEAESGIKVAAFAKYNNQRVPMWRRAGDPYVTIGDVPDGSTICVHSAIAATTVYSIIAAIQEGKDYRVGGGDYNLVIGDHDINGEMVARGDCVVGSALLETTLTLARTGELEMMYDGKVPWQIWRDDPNLGDGHEGIMSNLMVAREEWYDENEEAAAAFTALWQRGEDLWHANKTEIIGLYPQHFPSESQEDLDYFVTYINTPGNDFFVEDVYLTQEWIDKEVEFYDYMGEYGWLEAGFETPRFVAIPRP